MVGVLAARNAIGTVKNAIARTATPAMPARRIMVMLIQVSFCGVTPPHESGIRLDVKSIGVERTCQGFR
jgi:hypothetical protein